MAYPVTLNGRTYTLADFEGNNYVDGLPDAFEDFVTHAGDVYNDTSTTSNSIGTGSKTFTVTAGKPYQAGTPLRIADAAAPATNFLDAVVTSYSGTTLVVEAIGYGGSGTKTSWTVNIGGAKTIDGTLGLSQGGTGATTAAAARTNLDVYSKSETYTQTEADSRFLNVSGEASDVTMNGNTTIGDTNADTLTINAVPTIQTADPILKLYSTGSNRNTHIYMGDSTDVDAGRLSYDIAQDQMAIWTNGAKSFTINSDSTTSIINDNSGTGGANLHLYHDTASAEDGDHAGDLVFYSNSDAGNKRVFSRIRGYAEDVTDTSEDAILFFFNRMAGVERESLRLTSTVNQFNGANRDIDFKVSSTGQANMIFVDAADNYVGIGGTTPRAFTNIIRNANSANTQFDNPHLALVAATQPADNTGFVGMSFATSDSDNYGFTIGAKRTTGGSGEFVFRNHFNSTVGSHLLTLGAGSGTIFNEQGNNVDFRIESFTKSHMFFVDAGNNRVGINAGSTPSSIFHILDNDTVNSILQDTSANGEAYHSYINDVNQWRTGVFNDDTYRVYDFTNSESRIQIYAGAGMVINEGGSDRDFRVESDGKTHALFVDAGNNIVHINGSSSSGGDLNIHTNTASTPVMLALHNDDESASSGAGMAFALTRDGGLIFNNMKIEGFKENDWTGTPSTINGTMKFTVPSQESQIDALRLSSTTAIFNEGGVDRDFRVESDNNANMLRVDAQYDAVVVGSSGVSLQQDPDFAVNSFGLKSFAVNSNTLTDTGISLNQDSGGMACMVLASNHYSAGTSTRAAMYFLHFYYSGNNAPSVAQISGTTGLVTFGTSANNTLTVQMPAGGNAISFLMSG
jgi:hypothetical protein